LSNLVSMQSDQIIIERFQEGAEKEQHFTELVKRHQQKLYYQIKRMVIEHADADDIAQIVWMKVWEKLDGFKMESEFSTWLFRIGYNETINFILICVAYFSIGLILAGNYVQDKTIKITQDTLETLIKIEMVTEKQFSNLQDRVDRLDRMNNNRFSSNER